MSETQCKALPKTPTWPPKKFGPLSKGAVKELRDIVNKIKKGVYEHRQENWHCGTAHCIAGWKQTRDFARYCKGSLKIAPTIDMGMNNTRAAFEIDRFTRDVVRGPFAGKYAHIMWGLTDPEADYLFAGTRTIEEIEEAVDKFEQGLRMWRHSFNPIDEWDDPKNFNPEEETVPWGWIYV